MSKTTTQKTTADPWKPAQGALRDVIGESSALYQSGGMQVDPYTGSRVADFSPETLQAMQGLHTGSAVTPMATDAFSGFMDDSARNRSFDQMKATTIADTKAALGSTLAGGGLNTGLGAEMFGRGMGEAIGGIEYGAWGDAQNRKLSAMGMAPQIAGLGRDDIAGQLQAGGMQDQMSQNRINADMAQYYETQAAPYDALAKYGNLSAMMGGMGGSSTGTTKEPWSLGDVGKVVSGVGTMFSDRRLKENIRKVGETLGGNNIYSYNYKGGVVRHTGPMADEVPDAIAGYINGFAVVDYGKVK
jgi:hypothetical protein